MKSDSPYIYDDGFYDYLSISSVQSAAGVVPKVVQLLQPKSLLDVGCGAGAWLAEYLRAGIEDALGVDGSYVDRSRLLVDSERFCPKDVSTQFRLGRTFDLVQCLEVAEHVPPDRAEVLIDNLTAHSQRVLFSAATPGQGGENHINERNFEYWRQLFDKRGYRPFDCVRELIRSSDMVEPWYRYNILLYVHESATASLATQITETRVPIGVRIANVAPITYRIRCALLAPFPASVVTQLARLKHKMAASGHQQPNS